LAGEVIKTYPRLKPLTATALRVRSALVQLPLPRLEPDDVAKAGAMVRRYGGPNEPKFLEKVWAFKVLDVNARAGRPWEVEVQVVALGDQVAWVSLPGEIFVELGLAIKKASPFPVTILAELANGSVGYIPTRRAYAEGNYEAVSARCAEGSGEILVAAAIKLLDEVRP
jgi:neutral ceramidase